MDSCPKMMESQILTLIAALAAACCWSTPAHAQASDIAKRLLDEAKTLKDDGKIADACSLLDRSYELDAKDGVLFARADCRDKEGKIAAATQLYEAYLRAYSRMTGTTRENHAERAAQAETRTKELGPRVPMIKFYWAEPPPGDTKIIVDKREFRASMLESRLPLEPGKHVIVVLLPGKPERRRTITLTEGGSTIVDLSPHPTMSQLPAAVDMAKLLGSIKAGNTSANESVLPARKTDSGKIAGFIGVGLGVCGIAAGSVFGGLAATEKRVIDMHCKDNHHCDRTGLVASQQLQSWGNASTALFIAGGVLGAVGTTLLIGAYRNPAGSATAHVHVNLAAHSLQLGLDGFF